MRGKYKRKKQRKGTSPHINRAISTNVDQEVSTEPNKANDRQEQKEEPVSFVKLWNDDPKFRVEVIAVGGGLCVLVVYIFQLIAMLSSNQLTRAALNDSRDHFTQDQRPYVWIAGTPNEKGSASVVFGRDIVSGLWGPNVSFKNYGKSPAVHVRGDFRLVTGKDALSQVKDIDKISTAKGSIEVPGGDPDFQTGQPMLSLTDAQLRDLLAVDMGIVVYGRIDYSGTDGTEYWSKFCLVRQQNGAAGYCPGYSQIK